MVTNLHVWFVDPFTVLQSLSWLCLAGSIYVAMAGMQLLHQWQSTEAGEPDALIETGLYSMIRHPLYSALLLLGLSAFFKLPGLFPGILLFGAVFTLVSTVKAEEELDEKKFGPKYEDYRMRTKMFIPYFF